MYTLSICSCTQKLLHSCNLLSAWHSFHTCSLTIWVSPNHKNGKHFLMPIALNYYVTYVTYKNISSQASQHTVFIFLLCSSISDNFSILTYFVYYYQSVFRNVKYPSFSRFSVPYGMALKRKISKIKNKWKKIKKTGYFKLYDCFNNYYYSLPFFAVLLLQAITISVLTTNVFARTSQHMLSTFIFLLMIKKWHKI